MYGEEGMKTSVPASAHAAQSLPNPLRRRGTLLLNQQCWLWGQDIRRVHGNLLLERGFTRLRAPAGCSGSTQYTLAMPGNYRVRLWGFGFYFGTTTGIFLNRYHFTPRAAAVSTLWQEAQRLDSLARSHDFVLLAAALQWIAAYEAWVLETCGLEYRLATLGSWKRRIGSSGSVSV